MVSVRALPTVGPPSTFVPRFVRPLMLPSLEVRFGSGAGITISKVWLSVVPSTVTVIPVLGRASGLTKNIVLRTVPFWVTTEQGALVTLEGPTTTSVLLVG